MAGSPQRTIALLLAGCIVASAGLALSSTSSTEPPEGLAELLTVTALGVPLMAWLLLGCHAAAFDDPVSARLGAAFLFLGATQIAVYLLPLADAEGGRQALHPWAWAAAQAGFASVAAFHGLRGDTGANVSSSLFALSKPTALALLAAAAVVLLLAGSIGENWFAAPLAGIGRGTAELLASVAVFASVVTALAILAVRQGARQSLDLWLMVMLFGTGVSMLTGRPWQGPSMGWVVDAVDAVCAAAFLLALLVTSARLYREQALSNCELGRLARLDALTGLANRRGFDADLARAWTLARQEGAWVSAIFIDLDDFKQYNALYGHIEGDRCLAYVASVLRRYARKPDDLVCRYGGDEFVMLLYDTDPLGATEIAGALQEGVWAGNLPHAVSRSGRVTITLGVASVRPVSTEGTPEDLLRSADGALYRAKRARPVGTRTREDAMLAVG